MSTAGNHPTFWLPLNTQCPHLPCCPRLIMLLLPLTPLNPKVRGPLKGGRMPQDWRRAGPRTRSPVGGLPHSNVCSTHLHLRALPQASTALSAPAFPSLAFFFFFLQSASAYCIFSGEQCKGRESSRLSYLALPPQGSALCTRASPWSACCVLTMY